MFVLRDLSQSVAALLDIKQFGHQHLGLRAFENGRKAEGKGRSGRSDIRKVNSDHSGQSMDAD